MRGALDILHSKKRKNERVKISVSVSGLQMFLVFFLGVPTRALFCRTYKCVKLT